MLNFILGLILGSIGTVFALSLCHANNDNEEGDDIN